MGQLSDLFAPERVAVVGASEEAGSVGRAIVENLAEFDGEVLAVNPNRETVLGYDCSPSLSALPTAGGPPADVVVVVVPPDVVLEVLESAGELGVEHAVVITAGFGETGAEGARRETRLAEVAAEYDMNVVGPNSLGVMSTPVGMNATFGPEAPLDGSISFMSQSGAFVTAVLDWATDEGIGFKDVVSLGNKAVLDETDFVAEWGSDPDTDAVIGYVESIEDGARFVREAREATRDTPIVLVKSGRTEAGAQAASSHTGAIAGSEQAYEAGLRDAGVLRAESVQDLFDYARAVSGLPLPESDGVAVVTNAGGPGVMATDAVGDSTLSLASFGPATTDRLTERLPAAANVHNPVDVIGDAEVDRFADALDAALAEDDVGGAVVISAPTAVLSFDDLAERVIDVADRHDKPVVTALMGGERAADAADRLAEAGVPNYFDPARAVDSLDAVWRYRDIAERPVPEPRAFDVDRERAREVLSTAVERDTTRLGVEAMDLLDAYGIPTPTGEVVDSPDAARDLAEKIGDDVVMKIVSPDILHKSDIGGVKVGVPVSAVEDAYEDLVSRARNYQPDATVLGVQVQETLDLDRATETIVGANRDPQFGPLVLFGLGGVFVEILEDTALRVAPVDEQAAREMVDEIEAAPLLRGARGREPADVDAVVEAIERLGLLVTDFPSILELDVNPLLAGPDGATAVDLRLTVDLDQLEDTLHE